MPVKLPDINLVLLLPEILIALLGMALLLTSAWISKENRHRVGTAAIAGIALVAAITLSAAGDGRSETFSGMYVVDSLAVFMKILMLAATALPLLMSRDYLRRKGMDGGEYYIVTLFALLGGMIMASSGDFIMLYLGLELMSLSIYILAAFRRDDIASSEAGLKYFVLGSMASGILLYGITLIYGTTHTTQFSAVAAALGGGEHAGPVVSLGVIMVIAGMSFKVAAVPFHMWAPDVYEGAPTSVTAFMAVMPKVAAFAALFRVLLEAFGTFQEQWGAILQLLAVLSLAVGALAAIAQTNIKRMLAYSSIGHVGFILIGFATGSAEGYQSVLVYLTIYIAMNLGTFAIILTLGHDGIGEQINDFKGLAHKRPLLAFLMAMFMFSMAGIPPLAGFIGKLYVFMAAIKAGMFGLAIIGVLFSAVGAFYYLRIVKLMYFDQPDKKFVMPVVMANRVVIAISSFIVLFWGVFPGKLLVWTQATVQVFQ